MPRIDEYFPFFRTSTNSNSHTHNPIVKDTISVVAVSCFSKLISLICEESFPAISVICDIIPAVAVVVWIWRRVYGASQNESNLRVRHFHFPDLSFLRPSSWRNRWNRRVEPHYVPPRAPGFGVWERINRWMATPGPGPGGSTSSRPFGWKWKATPSSRTNTTSTSGWSFYRGANRGGATPAPRGAPSYNPAASHGKWRATPSSRNPGGDESCWNESYGSGSAKPSNTHSYGGEWRSTPSSRSSNTSYTGVPQGAPGGAPF